VTSIWSWGHGTIVNLFDVTKASHFNILRSSRKAGAGRRGMTIIFMVIVENHTLTSTEAASGWLLAVTLKKL
jgi:hypothetical protein